MFVSLLRAQNYEVIDLGVDVSAEQFLESIKAQSPKILAMSALLTTTMDEMQKVVQKVEEAGIRDSLKIIIGGAPVTEGYAEKIGVDAASSDAVEGVKIISDWFKSK